ncbi:MAG: Rap1a/Tai family immunity protein [Janthinobacterium lividum]
MELACWTLRTSISPVCFDFIGGLVQGLNTLRVSCSPSTATLNTMVRVYLAYMERHPKALDSDRSAGGYGAMKEAYPCPNK